VAEKMVLALLSAGATAGGRPALELARVAAGIPSVAGEAGEGVLPQEAGLEALVSYRKGCYLGQEIMARVEARGNLRRRLGVLRLEGEPSEGARDIRHEGRRVGRLGTLARHPGLGLIALAVLRSDLGEDASLEVGGAVARPAALPLTDTSSG
jgi:folate-binding protein YgfZ